MCFVQAFCDRCGILIQGAENPEGDTEGFYRMDDLKWQRYANLDEAIICHKCMFKDPRFQVDYEVLCKENKK